MTLDNIYNMMDYFHFEKGDIERWCSWDEAQDILNEKDETMIILYNQMINSKKLFENYLKSKEINWDNL